MAEYRLCKDCEHFNESVMGFVYIPAFCTSPKAPPANYVHGGEWSCCDLNPDGRCALWEKKMPEPPETRWWGWVWQIIKGER